MKALYLGNKRLLPELQEWQRSDGESKFSLTKFVPSEAPDDEQIWEQLPLETQIQELDVPFSPTLVEVLPSCPSIRKLNISAVLSTHNVEAISAALLQAPFIRSLALSSYRELNLSSLPLSTLTSVSISADVPELVAEALIRSKPKFLTDLQLSDVDWGDVSSSDYDVFARSLLECPSLTHLKLPSYAGDILPVIENLHRFPLSKLTLALYEFKTESIVRLTSFLSQSTVQDLTLGTLSPKQEQLLADVLPSLSCLKVLEFNTFGYDLCEHESSHLALFSALTSSPLRSFALDNCSFRQKTLVTCLHMLSDTQLTYASVRYAFLYVDSFDPTRDDPKNFQIKSAIIRTTSRARMAVHEGFDDTDFPESSAYFSQIEDRFCCLKLRDVMLSE
jgi:hypothetical protein